MSNDAVINRLAKAGEIERLEAERIETLSEMMELEHWKREAADEIVKRVKESIDLLNQIERLRQQAQDSLNDVIERDKTIAGLRAIISAGETVRPNMSIALMVEIYNQGYGSGHNDTVESCYTDIHRDDMTTWHQEEVEELLSDLGAETVKARTLSDADAVAMQRKSRAAAMIMGLPLDAVSTDGCKIATKEKDSSHD